MLHGCIGLKLSSPPKLLSILKTWAFPILPGSEIYQAMYSLPENGENEILTDSGYHVS